MASFDTGAGSAGPLISAAICTYRRYDLLGKAIASLAAQELGPEKFEILVIDNSPDADESALRSAEYSHVPSLSWISERTPGLANARNVATRIARGRFIAFMDDDAIASPGWLASLLDGYARFGDRTGVVGGMVRPIWQQPRPHWLPDDLLGYVSVVDWGGEMRITAESEWLAGTNISFQVSLLRRFGGFSTDLGRKQGGHALLSNEETHVLDQINGAGFHTVYAPEASVDHLVESSRLTQEWFRRRAAWQAVSDYLKDAAGSFARGPANYAGVLHFVNRLPPKDRSLRGLYVHQDDPALFSAQLSAIYCYTNSMLTGFAGVPE